MSLTRNLQIARAKEAPPLTPAQKRFNTLLRQIEQARELLAAWQENIPAYRQAWVGKLQPLQGELLAAGRQWVLALDTLLWRPGWTRAERTTLAELLCETAGQLLTLRGDDAELKAIFDRHADVDFETGQREAARTMKDLTQAMTGLDLGDDEGIHTEDDLVERMREGLEQQAAQREAAREARTTRRRKSAAQQKRDAEAQQAAQSLREIFRKLASALHPDREPDDQQRAAKTALMQRVNQAYAANDLLALLELQLQVEQIDASHIANAGAARLKHYNKVLDEQLAELRLEIDRMEMEWCMEFGMDPLQPVHPRKLQMLLDEEARLCRAELAQLQRKTRMLADPAATRRWLKQQRKRSGHFGTASVFPE